MEFNMEWNVICRICLQEGEMTSIFETDETNVKLSDMIMVCCPIKIKKGQNLPEQICTKCLNDLRVAYKFRMNGESSDAILQSFLGGNTNNTSQAKVLLVECPDGGEVYRYKPPSGLNVKRICKNSDLNIKEEPLSNEEDEDGELEFSVHDAGLQLGVCSMDSSSDAAIYEVANQSWDENNVVNESMDEVIDDSEIIYAVPSVVPVKQVKSVRTRTLQYKNQNTESKPVIENITKTVTSEGTTAVIRVRRNLLSPKPMKICEICGNTYKYKHALEGHMRRHRNEKPFSCETCGKAFVIAFELRRHMRTHTGQKPYGCRYCERKFSDFGSRVKHERTHTGERPYVCTTCGKAFAYSHVLSSHMLTHTGEKRFHCEHCGRKFTKSHHLKAHLNTHLKASGKFLAKSKPQKIETSQSVYENIIILKPDQEEHTSEDDRAIEALEEVPN